MRSSVRERFLAFTEPLEGGVPWPYADIRNLITIAYGNLIDPLSMALPLPFVRPDGSPATQPEITAAWLAVKGDPASAKRGHVYARGLTTLRLTKEGMADLALRKLDSNDSVLRARLTNWEDLPANAQLAMHSLAWACGPGANFPRLFSAVAAGDFDVASVEIHMNEFTPEGLRNAGLIERNVRNKRLMRNAARVRDFHLDPDSLNWETELDVISDEPTFPSLPAPAMPEEPEPKVWVDPSIYLQNDPDDEPPPDAA